MKQLAEQARKDAKATERLKYKDAIITDKYKLKLAKKELKDELALKKISDQNQIKDEKQQYALERVKIIKDARAKRRAKRIIEGGILSRLIDTAKGATRVAEKFAPERR